MAISLPICLLWLLPYGCGSSKAGTASWKSPTYQAQPYQKMLVFANTPDASNRRLLEDAAVEALSRQGISASTTYNTITGPDMQSAERIGQKAIELGADGLLAFTAARSSQEYRQGPSVGASVGVPVKIGFANIWLGGHVPIAGGNRTLNFVELDASFYNKTGQGPQWTMKLKERTGAAGSVAGSIASSVARQLKRDGVVL
ncbi:MAG TPA: hypothetical protein PKD90_11310 [Phnomibacter sp.]|nr:hypothetical protein [Phnomibacter sp.]